MTILKTRMSEKQFLTEYLKECADFRLIDVRQSIINAKRMILSTTESGGKIIFAGNGAVRQ